MFGLIVFCTDLMCKETLTASGYSGSISTSVTNRSCIAWVEMSSFVSNYIWRTRDTTIMNLNALSDIKNYCRNPDDDAQGPWCFVDQDTEAMEYCDIQACSKRLKIVNTKFIVKYFINVII